MSINVNAMMSMVGNQNAMMSMTGNQAVMMTPIGQAMTTQAGMENPGGFFDLIQNLMMQSANMQANPMELLAGNVEGGEFSTENLFQLLQNMTDQKPEEVSEALLAFLKQTKEVDLTKIDASWQQIAALPGFEMIANLVSSEESVSKPAAAKEVLMAIMNVVSDPKVNTDGVIKLEQALIDLGLDVEPAVDFAKQVEMISIQNTASQVAETIQEKPMDNQAMNVELVSHTVLEKEPKVVMESMNVGRPAVVKVDPEELSALKSVNRKEETLPMEEAINVQASGMNANQIGSELKLDESPVLKASVMDQVEKAVMTAIQKPQEEYVMKLKPEGLGEITIKMVLNEGGKILMNIQTQSVEVRSLISQELNQLKTNLVPMNVEIGEVSSYVTNEGFFQQSAYEQSRQQYQPEMQQKAKSSFSLYGQEEPEQQVVNMQRLSTGRLSRYV